MNHIIDKQCHCERCEARTKKTYSLKGHCVNCGWTGKFKVRFGDRLWSYSTDCPDCGVCGVMLSPDRPNVSYQADGGSEHGD